MLKTIMTIFQPAIDVAIVAIVSYIVKKIVEVIPHVVNYLVAKMGLANYQKMRTVGVDVWNKIEEHYRLNDILMPKIAWFALLMKQQFPSITDDDINLIRQGIAGEINKDKPIVEKEISEPTVQEVKVEPIISYVAPDGTKLQPVISTETNTEAETSTQQ